MRNILAVYGTRPGVIKIASVASLTAFRESDGSAVVQVLDVPHAVHGQQCRQRRGRPRSATTVLHDRRRFEQHSVATVAEAAKELSLLRIEEVVLVPISSRFLDVRTDKQRGAGGPVDRMGRKVLRLA